MVVLIGTAGRVLLRFSYDGDVMQRSELLAQYNAFGRSNHSVFMTRKAWRN